MSKHWRKQLDLYGGFLKWWYSTTTGFPTQNDAFGVFWGYHYFWKQLYTLPKLTWYCTSENDGVSKGISFFQFHVENLGVYFFFAKNRRNGTTNINYQLFREHWWRNKNLFLNNSNTGPLIHECLHCIYSYMCACLFMYIHTFLIYLSIYLSICLSVYLSIYPSQICRLPQHQASGS